MTEIDKNALIALKVCRHYLNWQQYKTLRGQVLAGDPDAAMKGLKRILQRREGEMGECTK